MAAVVQENLLAIIKERHYGIVAYAAHRPDDLVFHDCVYDGRSVVIAGELGGKNACDSPGHPFPAGEHKRTGELLEAFLCRMSKKAPVVLALLFPLLIKGKKLIAQPLHLGCIGRLEEVDCL